MFAGTHTALVTPFHNDRLDEEALRRLIDDQFANGITGVIPCGTTGESPTLDHEEHGEVIKRTVEFTAGRGCVIAGTGSNSTREAIQLTREAEAAGANAILQVAPYYNRPSQEGLFQHFKAVAQATSLPIMLYNIPGRCGVEIGIETVVRLAAACPNICAMKEASGSAERVSQMTMLLPNDFEVLSGDDSMTLPFMSVGGVGVVSVASNLIPGPVVEMVKLALGGDYPAARQIHQRYYPLLSAFLKLSTNPIPIKAAMALAGKIQPELRLPLTPMSPEQTADLRQILVTLGLLD